MIKIGQIYIEESSNDEITVKKIDLESNTIYLDGYTDPVYIYEDDGSIQRTYSTFKKEVARGWFVLKKENKLLWN